MMVVGPDATVADVVSVTPGADASVRADAVSVAPGPDAGVKVEVSGVVYDICQDRPGWYGQWGEACKDAVEGAPLSAMVSGNRAYCQVGGPLDRDAGTMLPVGKPCLWFYVNSVTGVVAGRTLLLEKCAQCLSGVLQ